MHLAYVELFRHLLSNYRNGQKSFSQQNLIIADLPIRPGKGTSSRPLDFVTVLVLIKKLKASFKMRYTASAECKYSAPFHPKKRTYILVMALMAAFEWLLKQALMTLLVIL